MCVTLETAAPWLAYCLFVEDVDVCDCILEVCTYLYNYTCPCVGVYAFGLFWGGFPGKNPFEGLISNAYTVAIEFRVFIVKSSNHPH